MAVYWPAVSVGHASSVSCSVTHAMHAMRVGQAASVTCPEADPAATVASTSTRRLALVAAVALGGVSGSRPDALSWRRAMSQLKTHV
jgi:hypothetical protein